MKQYDGMDTYGAPTKKEKFRKFMRRLKEMKIGEKAKKLYNKTVIPDKIKAYKEKKKFIRDTKEEAMKEKFKKEELAKLTKTKSGFMEKLVKGFDTGGQSGKNDMTKKILDGFSMGGQQNKDDTAKKILDGFSMGGQQNKDDTAKKILDGFSMGGQQDKSDKIGNMMNTDGLASDDKLKKMLGQQEEPVDEKPKKTKKNENKVDAFEDKIKRLLE